MCVLSQFEYYEKSEYIRKFSKLASFSRPFRLTEGFIQPMKPLILILTTINRSKYLNRYIPLKYVIAHCSYQRYTTLLLYEGIYLLALRIYATAAATIPTLKASLFPSIGYLKTNLCATHFAKKLRTASDGL